MPALYSIADFVFAPSTKPESFCLIVVESWAMGRPIIATEIGGPRELVHDNKTGWLMPIGEPDKFADKLLKIIEYNEESVNKVTQSAKNRVREFFSINFMCETYLKIFREMVKNERV